MRLELSLLLVAVLVSTGCTSDTGSYGNDTVINYEDGVSVERVENIHTALEESGFQKIDANLTKENSTRYTIGLRTGIEEKEIGLNDQYRFQQAATVIDYYAFNRSEVFQLNGYNTQGQLISQFTQ
ncbi:hypothetical protein ACK3SF_00815 [Candidatus Nanosalina sp. VS9-1]|uniref:hypothetical protein n=1 Tax=Candidatus Nanosalina sp. VS9-1 TaxID=3388566 RepID=UPI0039E0BC4F